jgi:hypothetical protein
MQSQSSRSYFVEGAPVQFACIDLRTSVAKQDFKPLLDFPFQLTLRSSKVHGNRLIGPITVGMPHNVGESFIDSSGDRPALHFRESQSLA